eukprot:TRINITY_DN32056_c0_g1_i1.p1 TRINITY_DN32056_c0_g1~~TRINITY_DN32056_c0_g1_i1.p1  ORF type:complete len:270 (+),score=45.84 TRINITY_DN32056_c0_g1_i1:62-871(+)
MPPRNVSLRGWPRRCLHVCLYVGAFLVGVRIHVTWAAVLTSAGPVVSPPFEGCRNWKVQAEDGSVWQILGGKTAQDNDRLSCEVGRTHEAWFHAAGVPGTHVVIRPLADGKPEPPSDVVEAAAGIAAFYCKLKSSARVKVHATRCGNIFKKPGAPAGQVMLRGDFSTMTVKPFDPAWWSGKSDPGEAQKKPTSSMASAKGARDHKRQQRLKRSLEDQIEQIDAELLQVETDLSLAQSEDPAQLTSLQATQERLKEKQTEMYSRWEALQR